MNYPQDRPKQGNRSAAVLLTIVLHLGLAYFLYTKATQATDHSRATDRQEIVQGRVKTP